MECLLHSRAPVPVLSLPTGIFCPVNPKEHHMQRLKVPLKVPVDGAGGRCGSEFRMEELTGLESLK